MVHKIREGSYVYSRWTIRAPNKVKKELKKKKKKRKNVYMCTDTTEYNMML